MYCRVQITLCDPIKGAIVHLGVPHPNIDCICMLPKGVSISEIVICTFIMSIKISTESK